ncbi:MAG: DUF418 domain-containing protein [Pseudomonadota bacterium]
MSASPMQPTQASDRIAYLDILRGFAVMAIFIVNIKAMMMPFPYYMNPSLWSGAADEWIAIAQKFLVDDKWRTIFTALYGAGLMMIWQRLSARDSSTAVLWYRTLWLMVFGALHLFGLWIGDILFIYGTTGLLAIFFVKRTLRTQVITGIAILAIGTVWLAFFSAGPVFDETLRAELKPMFWAPTAGQIADQVAMANGPFGAQVITRLGEGVEFILFYFLLGGMLPISLGLMILGMALYRSGLLRGEWPLRRTLLLACVCLGAAWTIDAIQAIEVAKSGYDFDVNSLNQWLASIDGYLGAFGYCCLVSVLVGAGVRFGAVAAVGRMAFSNYIACTLIGTTLAIGQGGGLFGQVSLAFLMLVVGLTFTAMLIWSPLWLKHFRYGPLEWLWRSLVYRSRQPMRRAVTSAN